MPYTATTTHYKITLYDLEETAQLLGVTVRTAWQYIRDGKIPANKIGGKYLISEQTILAYYHGAQMVDDLGNTLPRRNKKRNVKPPKYAQFRRAPLEEVKEIHGFDAELKSPHFEKSRERAEKDTAGTA